MAKRVRIIVSDVTYMHGGMICVAGWNEADGRMVRPLQPGGQHWPEALAVPEKWWPGNMVEFAVAAARNTRGLPHSREDTIVDSKLYPVGMVPVEQLATRLAPSEAPSVFDVFAGGLRDRKFVMSGTDCVSLGAVRVRSDRIWFRERVRDDGRKQLRCTFVDVAGVGYNLPVVGKILRDYWSEGGLDAAQRSVAHDHDVHLRLGLAHPLDDGKAYAMVNGLVST